MSSSNSTTEETRNHNSVDRRNTISVIRRMTVRVTSKPFWQAVGALLLDGVTREVRDSEVFSGVGFYARPKQGSNVDAILAFEDGAQNPYIIATRDEGLRRRVFPKNAPLGQDETAAFNTQAVMHIKAGTILAYLVGQIASAVGLAKASELNNLRAFVVQQFSAPGHTHTLVSGGTVTTGVVPVVLPVAAPATAYPGTTVLKGQ